MYRDLAYAFRDEPVFRIVHRAEFDHGLVRRGEEAGVVVRQGEEVRGVRVHEDHVEIVTDADTLRARVVVAADGARSALRQHLGWDRRAGGGRLLEVVTGEAGAGPPELLDGVATFDFSPMAAGLQGYYWDFPSMIRGVPFMNRGIYDRPHPARSPPGPVETGVATGHANSGAGGSTTIP